MKNYYVRVNGLCLTGFDQSGDYSKPILRSDVSVKDLLLIEGKFNLKSYVERLLRWNRETDEMESLEILDSSLAEDVDTVEDWANRKCEEDSGFYLDDYMKSEATLDNLA